MALSTYGQLKSAVAAWLERGDLTDRVPDFITLAESRLNRVLRMRALETEEALSVAQGSRLVTLPSGYREAVALWLLSVQGRSALRFVDAAHLEASTTPGTPRYWTLNSTGIALDRPADQAYGLTLRMLGRVGLSDAAPTNAILTDYPDLYLFGALVEAAPYLRDADLLALYSARFEAALMETRAKEARSRAISTLAVEPGLGLIGAGA